MEQSNRRNFLPFYAWLKVDIEANCSVMIWGCFSWSGLGTASQQSSWMYWMTRLSHQWIFTYLITRAYSRATMPQIHWSLVMKEWSMRTHEGQGVWKVIFTHELAITESWLYSSIWDVLENTEGMGQLSCHQCKISAKNGCNSGWK